jgi:hypothetical protein
LPYEELVYFGGPISAPGYPLHAISGRVGSSTRVEIQVPLRFIPIPLGRFGRVPGQARIAPYFNEAVVGGHASSILGGSVVCAPASVARCPTLEAGAYPSIGVGLLTIFDVLRFDVAHGLHRGGWMFNVDVGRDFWSIL